MPESNHNTSNRCSRRFCPVADWHSQGYDFCDECQSRASTDTKAPSASKAAKGREKTSQSRKPQVENQVRGSVPLGLTDEAARQMDRELQREVRNRSKTYYSYLHDRKRTRKALPQLQFVWSRVRKAHVQLVETINRLRRKTARNKELVQGQVDRRNSENLLPTDSQDVGEKCQKRNEESLLGGKREY